MQERKPAFVFLSYKRNAEPDETLVKRVHDALTALGHSVFFDQEIRVGEQWDNKLESEIRQCDYLIAFLSPESSTSRWVEAEIEFALNQAKKSNGKPTLLPVRVSFDGQLPLALDALLGSIQHAHWRTENDTEDLIQQLRLAISGQPDPPVLPGPQPLERPCQPPNGSIPGPPIAKTANETSDNLPDRIRDVRKWSRFVKSLPWWGKATVVALSLAVGLLFLGEWTGIYSPKERLRAVFMSLAIRFHMVAPEAWAGHVWMDAGNEMFPFQIADWNGANNRSLREIKEKVLVGDQSKEVLKNFLTIFSNELVRYKLKDRSQSLRNFLLSFTIRVLPGQKSISWILRMQEKYNSFYRFQLTVADRCGVQSTFEGFECIGDKGYDCKQGRKTILMGKDTDLKLQSMREKDRLTVIIDADANSFHHYFQITPHLPEGCPGQSWKMESQLFTANATRYLDFGDFGFWVPKGGSEIRVARVEICADKDRESLLKRCGDLVGNIRH